MPSDSQKQITVKKEDNQELTPDVKETSALSSSTSNRINDTGGGQENGASGEEGGVPGGSSEEKAWQQKEATRRENVLVMRLTTKEQEVHDLSNQLEELRASVAGGYRNTLLDPAVNIMFEKMKAELATTRESLEQSKQESLAWKFTADSKTGKSLMAKCRLLYQENEELGKMISSGRIADLEGDIAMSKTFVEELKKGQQEVDDLLVEMDDSMEGLQSMVYYLQQQLQSVKTGRGVTTEDPVLNSSRNLNLTSSSGGGPSEPQRMEECIVTTGNSETHLPGASPGMMVSAPEFSEPNLDEPHPAVAQAHAHPGANSTAVTSSVDRTSRTSTPTLMENHFGTPPTGGGPGSGSGGLEGPVVSLTQHHRGAPTAAMLRHSRTPTPPAPDSNDDHHHASAPLMSTSAKAGNAVASASETLPVTVNGPGGSISTSTFSTLLPSELCNIGGDEGLLMSGGGGPAPKRLRTDQDLLEQPPSPPETSCHSIEGVVLSSTSSNTSGTGNNTNSNATGYVNCSLMRSCSGEPTDLPTTANTHNYTAPPHLGVVSSSKDGGKSASKNIASSSSTVLYFNGSSSSSSSNGPGPVVVGVEDFEPHHHSHNMVIPPTPGANEDHHGASNRTTTTTGSNPGGLIRTPQQRTGVEHHPQMDGWVIEEPTLDGGSNRTSSQHPLRSSSMCTANAVETPNCPTSTTTSNLNSGPPSCPQVVSVCSTMPNEPHHPHHQHTSAGKRTGGTAAPLGHHHQSRDNAVLSPTSPTEGLRRSLRKAKQGPGGRTTTPTSGYTNGIESNGSVIPPPSVPSGIRILSPPGQPPIGGQPPGILEDSDENEEMEM